MDERNSEILHAGSKFRERDGSDAVTFIGRLGYTRGFRGDLPRRDNGMVRFDSMADQGSPLRSKR
jgi:hypothetical protein